MLNKEFFDKYFRNHSELVLYTEDNIRITISKDYHFHLNGGHTDFDIYDSMDLEELCKYHKLSIEKYRD